MGYWTYVQPRLVTSVGNKVKIRYNGHIFLILFVTLYGHKKNPRVWGTGPMFSHAFSLLLETKLRSGTMGTFEF